MLAQSLTYFWSQWSFKNSQISIRVFLGSIISWELWRRWSESPNLISSLLLICTKLKYFSICTSKRRLSLIWNRGKQGIKVKRKAQLTITPREDSNMKEAGMLDVSLRGVNFGFWSQLAVLGKTWMSRLRLQNEKYKVMSPRYIFSIVWFSRFIYSKFWIPSIPIEWSLWGLTNRL